MVWALVGFIQIKSAPKVAIKTKLKKTIFARKYLFTKNVFKYSFILTQIKINQYVDNY